MHRQLRVHFLLLVSLFLLRQFLVRMHPVRHPKLVQQLSHLFKIFLRRVAAKLAELFGFARQQREPVAQLLVFFQISLVNGDPYGHALFAGCVCSLKTNPLRSLFHKGLHLRSRADLNRCTRFCRPLPDHSAT